MINKDHLTNSSITQFKACRRKYYYSYELGVRTIKDKTALRIGSMVHEGIDLLAKGNDIYKVKQAIYDLYAVKAELYPDIMVECVTVQCLLAGYQKAWGDSKIEIIESETTFNLPILNDNGNAMTAFRQAGKRDRIGRLPDGRIALMETKTVGQDISPGSDYWNVIQIDNQISMYINAAINDGIEIETCVYDCVRKPTIKPVKSKMLMSPEEWEEKLSADIAERPEYYYQRQEIPRLNSELEEFRYELWQVSKDILECRKSGRWYKNTSNCQQWSSLCQYYPFCSKQLSLEDGIPDGFRSAETVHEELND